MDFFMKKNGMTVSDQKNHEREYTDYQNSLPGYMKPEDYGEFVKGFFSTIGTFRRFPIIWEPRYRIFRFPWLDDYWTRAGVVFLEEQEVQKTMLNRLRLQIASCLREANRRGDLNTIIDDSKGSNLSNWLLLGGSD